MEIKNNNNNIELNHIEPFLKSKNINGDKNSKVMSINSKWGLCGQNFPQSEIVFFAQCLLIYFVVIISAYNLTYQPDKVDLKLWVSLLSGCLGYLLPAPSMSRRI